MEFTLSYPSTVYIELTPACNNHCSGCSNVFASHRSRQTLDAELWEKILAKLQPYVHRIKITGGEPTLHPQFEAIISKVATIGIPFVLFTNARWPDPARLVDLLKESPQFRGFLVSVHGATAVSHEAFTGVPGSFAETLSNIRRAERAGLSITTSTVITRHNWAEIVDIVRLSQNLGAHHAVFNRYLGAPLPAIEPATPQLRTAIETIESVATSLESSQHSVKLGNCIPQCFAPSSSTGCLAGIAYCTIDPWGNVRPCNHAPMIVGNLLEQQIEQVWHSEGMKHWREMLAFQCQSCLELPRCHGGCRAVAMIHGIKHDPLMCTPIHDRIPFTPVELSLCEHARPIARFTSQAEPFGFVLVHENHIIPIPFHTKPVLDACDGSITLRQVQQHFGQQALNFIGHLCQTGIIELA